MNSKKKLLISTERFPFEDAELSFIGPELEELTKHFEVIMISHSDKYPNGEKIVGAEWDAYNINLELKWYTKIKYVIQYALDKDGMSEVRLIFRGKKNVLQRIYQSIGFYALAMENYKNMQKLNILPEDDFIYYTYWYFYYTYSLTKRRNQFKNIKIITRTHGFELFDERYIGGRQPFKQIMERTLDKIFFVADQGKNYYLEKYGLKDSDKYVVSRLGTVRQDEKFPDIRTGFRIVSCSSVIPLKRVWLLIDALSYIEKPVEWIHFGAGTEFDKTVQYAHEKLGDKANIQYEFRGKVLNKDILSFYSIHYVNCFISVSSTEGLPVSIQEALSFGIPVIATNVGGVAELVLNNGILLPPNPSEKNIAEAIENIMMMEEKKYLELRKNSYKLWKEKFDAYNNRKAFINILRAL